MGFSYVTLLKFAGRLAVGRGVQSSLYPRFCQAGMLAKPWPYYGLHAMECCQQWTRVSGPGMGSRTHVGSGVQTVVLLGNKTEYDF